MRISDWSSDVCSSDLATCDGPVTVLGHSMGGGVAAVLAAREPGLVARVGLFDAAGVRFADNQFGLDVLAGKNPFGVHDRAALAQYFDILRSEEHTSELQSLMRISYAVFCLKKKK